MGAAVLAAAGNHLYYLQTLRKRHRGVVTRSRGESDLVVSRTRPNRRITGGSGDVPGGLIRGGQEQIETGVLRARDAKWLVLGLGLPGNWSEIFAICLDLRICRYLSFAMRSLTSRSL